MIRKYGFLTLAAAAWLAPVLAPRPANAQLWTWSKEQMLDYTKAWTGARFDDGRPKVPDALLERAKGLSMEEVSVRNWGIQQQGGRGGGGRGPGAGGNQYPQYVGDWNVLHPGKKMVGRVVTAVFMPSRPDLDAVVKAKASEKGITTLDNQYVIDKLQPGDVLVVDLMNKEEGGTIVGDNLFYYMMKSAKASGLVVDGGFRDLEGIAAMEMPAYYKTVHPTYITNLTLAGYNVPIRIGDVTVMPGDIVVGDREGVSFVPPQGLEGLLDEADRTHIHDEWTRMKFDEGKYKSSEIYSTPRDQALRDEYNKYLQKRLEEIKAGRK